MRNLYIAEEILDKTKMKQVQMTQMELIEFSLNVFTEFAEFSDKILLF